MNNETHTLDGARAAILFTALQTALVVVRARRELRSARDFREALDLQIAAYEGEKAALRREFPTLFVELPAAAP